MNKEKILFVTFGMETGGLESVLINFTQELHKRGHAIEFVINPTPKESPNQQKLHSLGIPMYTVDTPGKLGVWEYLKALIDIMEKGRYDIVHAHNEYHGWLVAMAGLIARVPVRVIHSHTTSTNTDYMIKVMPVIRLLNKVFSTHQIAVSKEAGKFMFYGHFDILPNGLNPEPFLHPNHKRVREIEDQWDLPTTGYILGQVGRLSPEKNHRFTLELLQQLKQQIQEPIRYLIIGDGPEKSKLAQQVTKLNLEEEVLFVGETSEISEYLHLLDAHLFPSKFEGLGLAGIESQLCLVPTVVSGSVPKEIDIGLVDFKSLDDQESWVRCLLEPSPNITRETIVKNFNASGYGIKKATDRLLELYRKK